MDGMHLSPLASWLIVGVFLSGYLVAAVLLYLRIVVAFLRADEPGFTAELYGPTVNRAEGAPTLTVQFGNRPMEDTYGSLAHERDHLQADNQRLGEELAGMRVKLLAYETDEHAAYATGKAFMRGQLEPALVTAQRERDEAQGRAWAAEGNLAALADAMNGWCREVGVRESPNADMPNVREALHSIGYEANRVRVQRDEAQAALAAVADACDGLTDHYTNCDCDQHGLCARRHPARLAVQRARALLTPGK